MLQHPYTTIAFIVAAFVLAAVVARVVRAMVQRAMAALDVESENRAAVNARGGQLIGALTLLAYGVAALASPSLALKRFGVDEERWDPRLVVGWLVARGIRPFADRP